MTVETGDPPLIDCRNLGVWEGGVFWNRILHRFGSWGADTGEGWYDAYNVRSVVKGSGGEIMGNEFAGRYNNGFLRNRD